MCYFPLQALCFVKITENILVFFLFFEFSCCFYWCVCVVLFCFVVLVWFVFFVCLPLTVGVITAFRRGMKAGLLAFSTSRRYNGSLVKKEIIQQIRSDIEAPTTTKTKENDIWDFKTNYPITLLDYIVGSLDVDIKGRKIKICCVSYNYKNNQ